MIGAILTAISAASAGYTLVKDVIVDINNQKKTATEQKIFRKEFRKKPKHQRRDLVQKHLENKTLAGFEEQYKQKIQSDLERELRKKIREEVYAEAYQLIKKTADKKEESPEYKVNVAPLPKQKKKK